MLPSISVESLVHAAKSGDRNAFEQLARSYLRPAYLVALSIVRRPSDAEDVAQDAVILALERIESCREPERFVAWLMTIVRNHAKNWLAKRRLRDVSPRDPEDREMGQVDCSDPGVLERQRLLAALDTISAMEREVVLLHDLEGYTHDEIGQILNISCVMSRQHLFVSRRKLRRTLDIGGDDGGQDE